MRAPTTRIPASDQIAASRLSQIYYDHRNELARFILIRLANAVEAADVLQDLYLRIRPVADGPTENGRAYLCHAAQNLALDRIRERRRQSARDGHWLGLNHPAVPASEPVDDRRMPKRC